MCHKTHILWPRVTKLDSPTKGWLVMMMLLKKEGLKIVEVGGPWVLNVEILNVKIINVEI